VDARTPAEVQPRRLTAVTLVNAVLGVLYTGPLVWLLATHRFYNPEFVQGLHWGTADPLYWLTTIGVIVVLLTAAWDVAEVAIKAERTRRGLPPVAALNAEYDTAARVLSSFPLQMRRQRENDRNG
jgi:TM2 domain-containing membrane protein YozV